MRFVNGRTTDRTLFSYPRSVQRRPSCQAQSSRSSQIPKQRRRHVEFVFSCGHEQRKRSSACSAAAETQEAPVLDKVDIQEERLPNSRVLLTVTIPAKNCAKAWQKALRSAGKVVNIPGFRKGKKIPESTLIREVGKDALVQEAVESVLTATFPQITERYQDRCYGESLRIETEDEEMRSSFDKDKDFHLSISFDVQPELKWKGDYKKLKVEVEAAGNEESDQLLVEQRILSSMKAKGTLRVVTGRGLEKGDVVLIDFEARRADSGEPIAGSQRENMQLDTDETENTLGLPGIADELVGMTVGESRTVTQVVPDTWWETNLRGTNIACDIAVKELFSWEIPKLTDELAKQLLQSCSSVEDLRLQLMDAQRTITASETADAVNQALTLAVSDIVDVEVPEAMIREVATNEYQAQLLQMQAAGRLDRAQIEQLATEELLEAFIETRRKDLTRIQKGVLGFEEIFKLEGMSMTEAEIKNEAEQALGDAATSGEELDEERLLHQVQEVLKATKVLQWLTDNAEIALLPPRGEAKLAGA